VFSKLQVGQEDFILLFSQTRKGRETRRQREETETSLNSKFALKKRVILWSAATKSRRRRTPMYLHDCRDPSQTKEWKGQVSGLVYSSKVL